MISSNGDSTAMFKAKAEIIVEPKGSLSIFILLEYESMYLTQDCDGINII